MFVYIDQHKDCVRGVVESLERMMCWWHQIDEVNTGNILGLNVKIRGDADQRVLYYSILSQSDQADELRVLYNRKRGTWG